MHLAKSPLPAPAHPQLALVAAQLAPTDGPVKIIGKVTAEQGEAFIIRNGEKIPAKIDMALQQGDAVETQSGAQISLLFADRQTFVLKDKGMIALDEFSYDPIHKTGKATFLIAQGAFTSVSGDIAKTMPDAFRIATPTMTIGVRGTTVSGQVAADGTTSVALLADPGSNFVGEVVLAKLGGGDSIVINTAGSGIMNATSTSSWSVTTNAAASLAASAPAPVTPPTVAPSLPAPTSPGGPGHSGDGAPNQTAPKAEAAPPRAAPSEPAAAPAAEPVPLPPPPAPPPERAPAPEAAPPPQPPEPANTFGATTPSAAPPPPPANVVAIIGGDVAQNAAEDGNATASGTITVTDPNVGQAHIQAKTETTPEGTFTIAENGQWSFVVDSSAADVQALGAGQSLDKTFTVISADGSAEQTVTVTITGANDAPTTSAITLTAGTEDMAVTINKSALLANAADVDGDSPSLGTVTANHGTVVDNGNGTITVTPTANYNGVVTLSYTLLDGHGGSTAGSATMTLAAVNDTPTTSAITLSAGSEDGAVTFNTSALLANAVDLDSDTMSISAISADHGIVVDNGDGTITLTPSANYNGVVTLSYTVSDGTATIPGSASVTLAAVNDAPTTSTVTLSTGSEDAAVTINTSALLANAVDLDSDTMSISAITADHGSVVDNGDGTITLTPSANYNGVVTLSYTVSDGTTTIPGSATMTLAAVNDAPTTSTVTLADGTQDEPITFNKSALLVNAVDVEVDTTSVSAISADHGSVVDNGDGTITFTPTASYNGPVVFSYTISDGHGGSVAGSATMTENPHVLTLSSTTISVNSAADVVDADFTGFADGSADTLSFTVASGSQSAVLGSEAQRVGLVEIDATATTGAVTIDASGQSGSGGYFAFFAGSGTDTFIGSGLNDTITVASAALPSDTFNGGGGTNTLYLTDAATITDAMFANVSNVQTLTAQDASDVTLGTNSQAADITTVSAANGATALHVDASIRTDAVSYFGVNGTNVFTGGSGNDLATISIGNVAAATIDGGAGQDTLRVRYGGTLADADLAHVSNVETLNLNDDNMVVNLGANSQTAGMTVIDASNISGAVSVDASARTDAMTFIAGTGDDIFTGGSASDTISFASLTEAVTVDLDAGTATHGSSTDSLSGIESVIGTAYDDTLTTSGANAGTLCGAAGDDTYVLNGLPTADMVISDSAGSDTLKVAVAGHSLDYVVRDMAWSGTDVVVTTLGGHHLTLSGIEQITDPGWDSPDTLVHAGDQTSGDDMVLGQTGDTVLAGGGGDDTLVWVAGVTSMDGDSGSRNAASFQKATTAVVADLSTGTASVNGDTISLTNIQAINGGSGDDTLTGGSSHSVITGGDGNNTIHGGSGGATVGYWDSTNAVTANLSTGIASHGAWTDGLSNVDALYGSDLSDTLTGSSGDDWLGGGAGTNTLTGNGGDDIFVASASGTAVISDFAAGDGVELRDFDFALGSSGTLALANYAEESTSANAMSSSAHDFNAGVHNAGIVAINDGSGGANLWYSADMADASLGNSHQIAHVTVDTSAMDNTAFHLAV